jgi:hypothetical protein
MVLPIFELLTFWSTLYPQPRPEQGLRSLVCFVSTIPYMLSHLLSSMLSIILAIFGVFALGACLAKQRVPEV